MNFLEAIKSGNPCRRTNVDNQWIVDFKKTEMNTSGGFVGSFSERSTIRLTPNDILADDWEIKEAEAVITRTKFWEAAAKTLKIQHRGMIIECNTPDTLLASRLQDFAKELGL